MSNAPERSGAFLFSEPSCANLPLACESLTCHTLNPHTRKMPVPLPERYVPKYGDPVRYGRKQRTLRVSDFCQIMETWAWIWMKPLATDDKFQREYRKEFATDWRYIHYKIRKSNLLYRMLCRGEELRMRPCPTHKGRHGSRVPDAVLENGVLQKLPRVCECQCEDYLTGWLPNEPEGPQQLELLGTPLRQEPNMFIIKR
jgi:hypothetical protein